MKSNWTVLGCRATYAAVFAGLLLVGAGIAPGAGLASSAMAQAPGGQDGQAQADVTKALDNKRLRGVTAKVQGGVVTLTGTVENYRDKQDAGKKLQKFQKAGEIASVSNQIQVSGPEVSDQVIGQKLSGKLSVNNLVPERTAFEMVNLSVEHGVVTVGGFVTRPEDKDEDLGIVADQPGVKDVVDRIQVAPLSPNDDRIRRDVFRAIYGYQAFTKYAINPAKTIRILVLNGNVTLVGVVDDKGDKDMANIRANGVPGVFKVTNNLQVQGEKE
jgi:hyperosmotically inducible periplasmic protein